MSNLDTFRQETREWLEANCPPEMSLKEFDKKYRLPKKDSIKLNGTVRPMLKKDVPAVFKLFKD